MTLTPCWPEIGRRYEQGRGILVVGRATNGFEIAFSAAAMRSMNGRQGLIVQARDFAEREEPLSWVQLSAKRGTVGTTSSFWRVTRGLLSIVHGRTAAEDPKWHEFLAWSNLAKVAPHGRGNPSARLYRLQRRACFQALRQEIAELRPRVVLLIAGATWYREVLDALDIRLTEQSDCMFVRRAGYHDGTIWICTERPECRPESQFIAELAGVWSRHAEVTPMTKGL